MSRDVGAYCAVRLHAGATQRRVARQSVLEQRGPTSRRATVAGLESGARNHRAAQRRRGSPEAEAVTVAGFIGPRRAVARSAGRRSTSDLLILQAVVLAVLLIACANLANLQLTRLASRRKELAVRAALGAAGGRIVTMVLIEALLLALVGGVLGVAVAFGGLALVNALGLDRSSTGFEYVLDATALLYTLGAAVLAGIVSGLPPVLALLREDLTGAIREGGRQGGAGRGAQRMRGALVVAQFAMSVTLLVGAGLLTKSFYGLLAEGPGFSAERRLDGALLAWGSALHGGRILAAVPRASGRRAASVARSQCGRRHVHLAVRGQQLGGLDAARGLRGAGRRGAAAREQPVDRRRLFRHPRAPDRCGPQLRRRTKASPSRSSTRLSPRNTGRTAARSDSGCGPIPIRPIVGRRSSVSCPP